MVFASVIWFCLEFGHINECIKVLLAPILDDHTQKGEIHDVRYRISRSLS